MKHSPTYLLFLLLPFLFGSCATQKRFNKLKNHYMEQNYATLKENLKEAEVTIVNDSIKLIFPNHLIFRNASSDLSPDDFPLLRRLANTLNIYQKTNVLINGYTDSLGSKEFNQRLSLQRAVSTANALIQESVDSNRLYVWGHGSKGAIGDNKTAEGRWQNRRVELVILYNPDVHLKGKQ